jgi:hypothetical protein
MQINTQAEKCINKEKKVTYYEGKHHAEKSKIDRPDRKWNKL